MRRARLSLGVLLLFVVFIQTAPNSTNTSKRQWKIVKRPHSRRPVKIFKEPRASDHHYIDICAQGSCFPATGDLLIARQSRLSATSTCGLEQPERYCVVSHLDKQYNQCFMCDSTQNYDFAHNRKIPNNHRIPNIVSSYHKNERERWWQSENGIQNVTVQLDLEAEFHFTHLIMTFKTFRPAAMFIEKSSDFGKTWKVYRYFAQDCKRTFPHIPRHRPRDLTTVTCESKYSSVEPSTGGQVVFQVLPRAVHIKNPYSQEVQDLLKITNIRINFTRLHTLGDNLLTSKPEIKEKYYYALYNMVVRGSCSCYGHAKECQPITEFHNNKDMVGAKCKCSHNTKGYNCEQCLDFYHDFPWRPALGNKDNACKRCNCNDHSIKCHFDAAVFVSRNFTSGGVCDECQHNTMGPSCGECKPFFYQRPGLLLNDPNICASCDCDPLGSELSGECEMKTDPLLNTVAGRCSCKDLVEGERCDTCKDGFWNLSAENPRGCEACNCDPIGSLDSNTCDKRTGDCRCKRFIGGRRCDQCLPGYWQFGLHQSGCLSCDCDIGGSYSINCSQSDGSCNCRPNIIGQYCNQLPFGYFVPNPDWLTYEAELADQGGEAVVIQREFPEDRKPTWSGSGFSKVQGHSWLEFHVNDLPYSTHYDIIVVYEPQNSQIQRNLKLTVVRPPGEQADLTGHCSNVIHADYGLSFDLEPTSRHQKLIPSSCLEAKKYYKIKIEYDDPYRHHGQKNEQNQVLIDSIILVPSADHHPALDYTDPRNLREEYDYYGCVDRFYSPSYHSEPIDTCKMVLFSTGAVIHDGAKACDCHPTGSYDFACDPTGGQCKCKPNVTGRRCDKCSPGTWGLSREGCQACACNFQGSNDNFCDQESGQCICKPGAFARDCSECHRGHWGYPYCRPCNCNELADDCDQETGKCLGCRNFAGGDYCERCADGFYGDPNIEGGCKECMCPGGRDSGMQHGASCDIDPYSQNVVCRCKEGYEGPNCDRCAPNYFGNPLVPGGTCKRCECNENIDYSDPGSCDQTTGQCLKCLHNTKGFSCEICAPGYYGDATIRNCIPCSCNPLGTNKTLLYDCDNFNGQCQCLPHVYGRSCDECDINHWNLASGKGCESCACDPDGSLFDQCHPVTGLCDCKTGKGGRDCSECPENYWGFPKTSCIPCDCNRDGSLYQNCSKETGQCYCAEGITGLKCDRCARGTTGSLPYCAPCGECFDNWDLYISSLKSQSLKVYDMGREMKSKGTLSNLTSDINNKTNQIQDIVNKADVDKLKIEELAVKLNESRIELEKIDDELEDQVKQIEELKEKVEKNKEEIKKNEEKKKAFKDKVFRFTNQSYSVEEDTADGAVRSLERSKEKYMKLEREKDELEKEREYLLNSIKSFEERFNIEKEKFGENNKDGNPSENVKELNQRLNKLTEDVCGANIEGDEECDEKCGGAKCGFCGNSDMCQNGVTSKSLKALNNIEEAEKLLKEKEKEALRTFTTMSDEDKQINKMKQEIEKLMEEGTQLNQKSNSSWEEVEGFIKKADEYKNLNYTSREELEEIVSNTLDTKLEYTPEEMEEFKVQLKEVVGKIKDTDSILLETGNDISHYDGIKMQTEAIRNRAEETLNRTKKVKELLENATRYNEEIKESLKESNEKIEEIDKHLLILEETSNDLKNNTENIDERVKKIKERSEKVKQKLASRSQMIQYFDQHLSGVLALVERAQNVSVDLDLSYTKVNESIIEKEKVMDEVEPQMNKSFKETDDLYQSISSKNNLLRTSEADYRKHEEKLRRLSTEAENLFNILQKHYELINRKAKFLHSCTG